MRFSTYAVSSSWYVSLTACALMVMPRSRSRSIRSRYWSRMSRAATAWVSSRIRSASVDFPWSMWATMQKFRRRLVSVTAGLFSRDGGRPAASERVLTGRSATIPLVDSLAVANIKSQIKRNRQNERRRERNKAVRTELKTAAKKARTAVSEGGGEAATELLRSASRAIDKAASGGIVHKRAAARRKSRLAKAAGATGSEG